MCLAQCNSLRVLGEKTVQPQKYGYSDSMLGYEVPWTVARQLVSHSTGLSQPGGRSEQISRVHPRETGQIRSGILLFLVSLGSAARTRLPARLTKRFTAKTRLLTLMNRFAVKTRLPAAMMNRFAVRLGSRGGITPSLLRIHSPVYTTKLLVSRLTLAPKGSKQYSRSR